MKERLHLTNIKAVMAPSPVLNTTPRVRVYKTLDMLIFAAIHTPVNNLTRKETLGL